MKGIAFLPGLLGGLITFGTLPATAQVISDGTTNTTVNTNGNNFTILNGIQRENNLFHSFREFSIPRGGSATFQNPSTIVNIINRVTGGNISNIDGLIKANGSANLFLINPGGIVFRENARLDIGGSFLGTTAESILFEDGFEFSAVNAQSQPLLSVSVPVGLQYGVKLSSIKVKQSELSILPTKTLALLGGDIIIDSALVNAPGGRIELGGLSAAGTINIENSITFPESTSRGNVSLKNGAIVDVSSVSGGSIAVNVANLKMSEDSKLQARLLAGDGIINLGNNLERDILEKDIIINATGEIKLSEKSLITNSVDTDAVGDGGKIELTTNSLFLRGGSRIQTKTDANGFSGDININVNESIDISGYVGKNFFSGILTIPGVKTTGNGGNISIKTNNLRLAESARISLETKGAGNSGNLFLQAQGNIDIVGANPNGFVSRIDTEVDRKATGNGGNVTIETNNLRLVDGARISLETEGQGNAGNLDIKATGNIEIIGISPDGIVSRLDGDVEKNAAGSSGNITIETNNLRLANGGRISIETESQGNAGNLDIKATGDIEIIGTTPNGIRSRIDGDVAKNAIGNGSNIVIESNNLRLIDGARISVQVLGKGNAGNLEIKTKGDVELIGSNFKGLVSHIASEVDDGGTGSGGNIFIESTNLRLLDGGRISVETEGAGNGGKMEIRAKDTIEIRGIAPKRGFESKLEAQVDEFSTGNGGNILVETNNLKLIDGGLISVDTQGQGKGGFADIRAKKIELVGISTDGVFPSRITAASNTAADAGSLKITTDNLKIRNGAEITVSGLSSGNAGNLDIKAGYVLLDNQGALRAKANNGARGNINLQVENAITASNNSQISADVTGNASGGIINLIANKLEFTTGSFISTNTTGAGNGGSINLVGNTFSFDGKQTGVFSQAVANSTGNGGNIYINAGNLQITNNANVSTNSLGLGQAGDINITANTVKTSRGNITATSLQTGGGNLFFNTDNLILRNNSLISSSVLDSIGGGGNITINSPVIAGFENSDIIANAVQGNGGNINITTQGIFGFQFRDRLTANSDITASSQFGVNGTVEINNFEIDPSSGLVELPVELTDPSKKIASECSSNTNSSFVATGRGGIPDNPSQYLDLNPTWSDIRDLSAFRNQSNRTEKITQISNQAAIVEATGFIRNQNGEIELVALKNSPLINKQVSECSGKHT